MVADLKKNFFLLIMSLRLGQRSTDPEDPSVAAILLRSQQAPREGHAAGAADDVWLESPSLQPTTFL